ncbi:hypothetical protein PENNAL_c0492G03197 [Penicillium nalgiovense]|uniref:Uncharacterized protein n=2 Tax=Penicillium nalgiovense TaxID=60175 RepID=A0A1V6VNQ0_PENNA|nr:hypothetical protein PENNAL_c0492G03197 [Penicillium nalgiovense]
MVLSSNEKRAFSRQQCREALAAHIHNRLGLVVAPSQVRLQPSAGDGYAWSVTDSKKSLLQSNLGSGSVDATGCPIRTGPPAKRRGDYSDPSSRLWGLHSAEDRDKTPPARSDKKESGSFTAKIRELECANREMSGELDRTRMHLKDFLREKNEMQAEILRLQGELGGVSSRASHLEDELVRVTRGIREAMQVLEVHQTREGSAAEHGEGQDVSVDSVDGTVLETPPFLIRVDAS